MADESKVDLSVLRKLLSETLKVTADLDAFISDHYPDIYRRFTDGMDNTQKITLLMRLGNIDEILIRLREQDPQVDQRFAKIVKARSASHEALTKLSLAADAASSLPPAPSAGNGAGALGIRAAAIVPATAGQASAPMVAARRRARPAIVAIGLVVASLTAGAAYLARSRWEMPTNEEMGKAGSASCNLGPWLKCMFSTEVSLLLGDSSVGFSNKIDGSCSGFLKSITEQPGCHQFFDKLYKYAHRMNLETQVNLYSICYAENNWLACILLGNSAFATNQQQPNQESCKAYQKACELGQKEQPQKLIACAPLYVRERTYAGCMIILGKNTDGKHNDRKSAERVDYLNKLCELKVATACRELGNLNNYRNDLPAAFRKFHECCGYKKQKATDCAGDDLLRPECDQGAADCCFSAGKILKHRGVSLSDQPTPTSTQYLKWAAELGQKNAIDELGNPEQNKNCSDLPNK